MINLRLKFKKKTVSLPIFSYDKGIFKIIIPIYDKNGNLIDIAVINLPQQVVTNPTVELYRFLRMRGVI